MTINMKRILRSKAQSTSNSTFYKPKPGRNIIRVMSFKHTVSKDDFVNGLYRETDEVQIGSTYDEIEREVYRHYTENGVINCMAPGECIYCNESAELLKSANKKDIKAGNDLSAVRGYYMNVVDIEHIENGVLLGCFPTSVFSAIINYVADAEFGPGVLNCNGRDFIIDKDPDANPANMYTVRIRDKERCDQLPADILANVKDLFELAVLSGGWTPKGSGSTNTSKRATTNKVHVVEDKFVDDVPADKETFTDGDTDDKLPWEKQDKKATVDKGYVIELGDTVSFDDSGEEYQGVVVEVNGGEYGIKVGPDDNDIFDIPVEELNLVKKGSPVKSSKRRRK